MFYLFLSLLFISSNICNAELIENSKNYIVIGKPFSGKGTYIKQNFDKNYFHLSSGEMLRNYVKNNQNEITLRINNLMQQGKLIDDKLLHNLVIEYLEKEVIQSNTIYQGIIFDGYPRNMYQYKRLKKYLNRKNLKINQIILLNIRNEEVYKRFLASNRNRDDDNKTTLDNRLEIYNKETKPLIDYLQLN